jgi:hypothetical protein
VRRFLVVVAVVVAGQLGLLGGAAVAAAASAELHVSPSTVVAGHTVRVFGRCEPNAAGFALSEAFLLDPKNNFGIGTVSFNADAKGAFSVRAVVPRDRTPGTYTVTARCSGGNLGISVQLKVLAASGQPPTAVPAGSGGQAATTAGAAAGAWQFGLAAAGLTLLAGGAFGASRSRRRAPR